MAVQVCIIEVSNISFATIPPLNRYVLLQMMFYRCFYVKVDLETCVCQKIEFV